MRPNIALKSIEEASGADRWMKVGSSLDRPRRLSSGATSTWLEKAKEMIEVRSAEAPAPGGHYAQGVIHAGMLYVSGQLGLAADNGSETSAADQVTYALVNVERIAKVAGANRNDVVRCPVYVADIAHWSEADRAYAAFFRDHKPARVIVPSGALHFGCLVEVDAIVAIG